MKAIRTKYLGPTNVRGSRVKAWEPDGKSITLSYDPALDVEGNARVVAEALRDKLNWKGDLICGWLKNGYVFVFGPRS